MGGKSNETTTTVNPWGPAADRGVGILDDAHKLYLQQGGINGNWINFQGPQVNQNLTGAWDKLAQSNQLNQAAGNLTDYGLKLTGSLSGALEALQKGSRDITMYDVQSMRDTFLADQEEYLADNDAAIQAALDKSVSGAVGQIYGAAAGSGNVGSSRTQLATGIASGNLASDAHTQMMQQRTLAYNSALQQANQQLTGNRQAQLQAAQQGFAAVGQGMGAIQAGAGLYQQAIGNQLQAGLQQFQMDMQQAQIQHQNLLGQQNAGWQNLGLYNQLVGGWAGAGGSTTTNTPNNFNMGSALGMLGGAAIGSMWGIGGAQLGMGLGGGIGGMFG